MSAYIFWACLGVIGVGLAVAGTRKPTLMERVEALRPAPMPEQTESPVFTGFLGWNPLEAARPAIENAGRRLARRSESLALFIGNKAFLAVVGLVLVPAMSYIGLFPGVPAWIALVVALAAWFLPDLIVREQGRARAAKLEDGLVDANLDIALSVASGAGLSEAVEGARRAEGPFAQELAAALARATAARRGPADALDDLAQRTGLEAARDLASALRAAEQGAPLAETLLVQARSISERHRLESLAAGQRAEILMLLVQAGLILPGFFVLILYPVAATLLKFANG
jgi:tight adherence protein C